MDGTTQLQRALGNEGSWRIYSKHSSDNTMKYTIQNHALTNHEHKHVFTGGSFPFVFELCVDAGALRLSVFFGATIIHSEKAYFNDTNGCGKAMARVGKYGEEKLYKTEQEALEHLESGVETVLQEALVSWDKWRNKLQNDK